MVGKIAVGGRCPQFEVSVAQMDPAIRGEISALQGPGHGQPEGLAEELKQRLGCVKAQHDMVDGAVAGSH